VAAATTHLRPSQGVLCSREGYPPRARAEPPARYADRVSRQTYPAHAESFTQNEPATGQRHHQRVRRGDFTIVRIKNHAAVAPSAPRNVIASSTIDHELYVFITIQFYFFMYLFGSFKTC